MSPLTRAQLLRRAVVGGVALTLGDLPEQLAKTPGPQFLAPARARTAVPTSVRLVAQSFSWPEDQHPSRLAARPIHPAGTLEHMTDDDPNLTAITAQRVTERVVAGDPIDALPVFAGRQVYGVLPPQGGRFFQAEDVVRTNTIGDLYLVGPHRPHPDVLRLAFVGTTLADDPIIDPRREARELHALMPL